MWIFLGWYILISVLGALAFPIAWRLLPTLADRGYGFSRSLGLLLWGFFFWWLVSLGVIRNDATGLIFAFLILLTIGGWAAWKIHLGGMDLFKGWLKKNRRVIITTEVLFFCAFAFWAFVRANNPELTSAGGEKTMEVAFINAIMRSPTFPPHDPWLSGYAISYYYFGYVLTAILAEATGAAGSVAHNLMLALIFALSASGAYSVVHSLLAAWHRHNPSQDERSPSAGLPLLGPFFLLIASNWEGFLEVLHSWGLFQPASEGGFNFWSWLGIVELNSAVASPAWPPRYYWWWRASRVIQDIDLTGTTHEIIDEFPFFSYLLGDLHAHVLAMPFLLLGVGVALNLYQGGWDAERKLLTFPLRVSLGGIFFMALVLGGMAFLNTWDILALMALVLLVFLVRRSRLAGFKGARLDELVTLALPLAGLSMLLYLPFYLGFASQAGGILPNLVSPTRGVQLWVMFAVLLVPLFAWLIARLRAGGGKPRLGLGIGLAVGFSLLMWAVAWLLALLVNWRYPDVGSSFLISQGAGSIGELFMAVIPVRLRTIGGWLTLAGLLAMVLALLFRREEVKPAQEATPQALKPDGFVLCLMLLAGVLVLAPEYVYLRDNFGWRMNTVFKFYYQAWELWALAAAFASAVLLRSLRGAASVVFRISVGVAIALACFYPVLALWDKTSGFHLSGFAAAYRMARESSTPNPLRIAGQVWTLDGGILFQREYPEDALAVAWLADAPDGILVEAIDGFATSYSDYGHISAYSGLPTVLGWGGHEAQWRGTYEGLPERYEDIRRLYETDSWEQAQLILDQYQIRYVYVGTLERRQYGVSEAKFDQFLQLVYRGGQVAIYAVP